MDNILLADKNSDLTENGSLYLTQCGYNVLTAKNEKEAVNILKNKLIDLCIIDFSIPKISITNFISYQKKAEIDIPNIVTAFEKGNNNTDILEKSFEAGADDFLLKPINFCELELRIKAILRRDKQSKKVISVGKTTIDCNSLIVTPPRKNLGETLLTKKEFYILCKLLLHPNRIFTRKQIMNEIWDFDSESKENTVDVHINRLRKKLKNIEDFKIITVKNIGYKAILTK